MIMRWLSMSTIFGCATSLRRIPVAYSVINKARRYNVPLAVTTQLVEPQFVRRLAEVLGKLGHRSKVVADCILRNSFDAGVSSSIILRQWVAGISFPMTNTTPGPAPLNGPSQTRAASAALAASFWSANRK